MKFLKKSADFILYTNTWIGLAAFLLCIQTSYHFERQFIVSNTCYFVLCSTIWLYSLHRIIGLKRITEETKNERFTSIASLKNIIYPTAVLSFVVSIYFFFNIPTAVQKALIVPALVSILYVVPIFSKNRRLRDIGIIKIFLIGIIWAWVTTYLPLFELPNGPTDFPYLLFSVRLLFILAITIPFDIRDLEIDKMSNIKTIPSLIGKNWSILISSLLLVICFLIIFFGADYQSLNESYKIGILLSYVYTFFIILVVRNKKHDYYFTGLLDGTMILQFLITYSIMHYLGI